MTHATEKGYCYHDCFLLLIRNPDHTLVHGYPTLTGGPYKGKKYGHAWLEFDDGDGEVMCLDYNRPDFYIPRTIFYAVGQIDPRYCSYYTFDQAMAEIERHPQSQNDSLYPGPWHESPADALFAD